MACTGHFSAQRPHLTQPLVGSGTMPEPPGRQGAEKAPSASAEGAAIWFIFLCLLLPLVLVGLPPGGEGGVFW